MGILQSLFGGSSSSNSNNNMLTSALGSTVSGVGGTSSILASLLGIGNPAAGTAGFDAYKNNAGFNFALGEGMKGITGNHAAKGILNSGMTGKAYMNYGQGLQSQMYGDYIKQLLGLGQLGVGAAGVLSDSGKKESKSTGNLGSFLGSVLGSVALSDRRLKENITLVGYLESGLPVYTYEYVFDRGKVYKGVMADEVSQTQPEALGPKVGDYQTVDYSKLR